MNPATGKVADYWKIAYREGRAQRRYTLGFVTKAEASMACDLWNARSLLGDAAEPPTISASSRGRIPTLREWWGSEDEDWPPAKPPRMYDWVIAKGYQRKTVSSANSARRAFLPLLGDKSLRDITAADGDAFVRVLRERKLKTRTAQIYLQWLQQSLKVAARDGIIEAAPQFSSVTGDDRRASPWATPEEMDRLYAELDRRVSAGLCTPDVALAIRMAETLFMRIGEVCTRRWQDLSPNADWSKVSLAIRPVQLPDGTRWTPKNRGSTRTVPLPALLRERLRDHWNAVGQPTDGWIFRGRVPGHPLTSFKKTLASASKAIRLAAVLNPHALRHTGATRLARKGIERRTVMKIGGWTTGVMLDEVYEHTSDERAAEALEAAEVGAGR